MSKIIGKILKPNNIDNVIDEVNTYSEKFEIDNM